MNREQFEAGLRALGAQGIVPEAQNIVDDTREVKQGDIFVLRQGASPLSKEQAEKFCAQATASGAAAIIADPKFELQADIPVIALAEPHLKLSALAEAFYGNPTQDMKIVAVTGTNGKTTTTYLIESLARALGLKVGVLGTISHRYPGYEEASANTTPGTLKLRRLHYNMKQAGCDLVAMEVSSHGIVQGRVDGVRFDAAIWNNLGTDHLDFHKTREAYALAKQRLFDHYLAESFKSGKSPTAIANADDSEVLAHIHAADPSKWGGRLLTFSTNHAPADLVIHTEKWENNAWNLALTMQDRTVSTRLPLIGEYNIANAAGAISALHSLGFSLDALCEALPRIAQIPGRMECVYAQGPIVIVDFAHTPEALENALLAARSCLPDGGQLSVVFGAGGDRDPSKRPIMGAAAAKYADHCFITSDNPRTEDPESVIAQILDGMDPQNVSSHDIDREKTIRNVIASASHKDVILVAGKGHEDYQILGTQKIHFDDREICRDACSKL
ncbi:MAG: UDP-N-acetylmuramoyl-L-alanyl-D-glutamate--2,6-diaminopimelate ligase [Proteobacteria bacterium]|nr:UDP-N-acetylmuramoyl-L-alanyl-D-glutamate--2,6-diaminopimelate ligase [Pseudomonadota bacterium]